MWNFQKEQRVMINDTDPEWVHCWGMVGRFTGWNNGLAMVRAVNTDGELVTLFVPPSMVVAL